MTSKTIRRAGVGALTVAMGLGALLGAVEAGAHSVEKPKLSQNKRSAKVAWSAESRDSRGWHRGHVSLIAMGKKGSVCAKQTSSLNLKRGQTHSPRKTFRLTNKTRKCLKGLSGWQTKDRLRAHLTYQHDKNKDGRYDRTEVSTSAKMKKRCMSPGRKANLKGCKLAGHHMPGANLKRAKLKGADLHGMHLGKDGGGAGSGAQAARKPRCAPSCQGADLSGADLSYADLTNADLTSANLTNATLTAAQCAVMVGCHRPVPDRNQGSVLEASRAPVLLPTLLPLPTLTAKSGSAHRQSQRKARGTGAAG